MQQACDKDICRMPADKMGLWRLSRAVIPTKRWSRGIKHSSLTTSSTDDETGATAELQGWSGSNSDVVMSNNS